MPDLIVRHLGRQPYQPIWQAMQRFTDARTPDTVDELWVLEHDPVFTQGQAGKPEHMRMPGDIPVVAVDRGGQVTYHGPGQIVAYPLLDLRRLGIGVRDLVCRIEQAINFTHKLPGTELCLGTELTTNSPTDMVVLDCWTTYEWNGEIGHGLCEWITPINQPRPGTAPIPRLLDIPLFTW